jgi:Tol biopolymer transport system component
MRQRCRLILAAVGVVMGLLVVTAPARATFPGRNGRIAFVRGPDIYTMKPDGSGVRRLTSLGGDVSAFFESWSPDGRQIVFNHTSPNFFAQLWIMNADGSNQHQVLNDPGAGYWAPRFSPDGKAIIVAHCVAFEPCRIARIRTDGSGLTLLTGEEGVFDFHPGYSPDGSTVAFSSDEREGVITAVHLMNADGSNVRLLSPPELLACCPDWSPDGSRIAFHSNGGDPFVPQNAEIWVINADGTGLTQLTDTAARHDFDPSWAPEGNAIAFDRANPDFTSRSVFVMRPDGSGLKRIQRDAHLARWGALPREVRP